MFNFLILRHVSKIEIVITDFVDLVLKENPLILVITFWVFRTVMLDSDFRRHPAYL